MKLKSVLIVALAILLAIAAGCGEDAGQGANDGGDQDAVAPEAVSYTDSPTLEMIPDAQIKGEANGREFIAKEVFFTPLFGKWILIITDKEHTSPTTNLRPSGSQHIDVHLPEMPETGKEYIRSMQFGDGYFHVRTKDNPEEFYSWNADNAYAILITSWEFNYDPEGSGYQIGGYASGKVFISYSGNNSDDFEDSWVAGTFTDAPIRHWGEPEIKY